MNSDFRDANIQAILGSYSEVVTDGDPVLKSGAGTAFGRSWEAYASNRAKAGFSLVEILRQQDRGPASRARGCLRACGRVRRGSVRVPPGLGGGDEGLVPLGDL